MSISLEVIQELAPDQASLTAAKKLLSPAKWPVKGQSDSTNTIWGQCQGSGANPYYTMADVVDHGYKCTCPSRKFPCKHVLALYWQYAETPDTFSAGEPPDWVNEWLARRRKGPKKETDSDKQGAVKNIQLARDEPSKPELSPEQITKREVAQAKRAAKMKANTTEHIHVSLNEFQQWISDQLRTGIGSFIHEMNERCRRIAARLVDAKAANLASRMDELPAKILSLNREQQAQAVMNELGQLVLLCEAWFTDPNDPDAHRAVCRTETREQVLENRDAIRKSGVWEKVGEQIETRRDGLISHITWLLQLREPIPRFAMLQDFYPAATGKRQAGVGIGRQFFGEVVYYPSRAPMRAFIAHQEEQSIDKSLSWPVTQESYASQYLAQLKTLPWQENGPILLGPGTIFYEKNGSAWWCSRNDKQAVQLSNSELNPLLIGCELTAAFMVKNGEQGELLRVQTARWGAVSC